MRIRQVPAIEELIVGGQSNINPASHSLAGKRHATNLDSSLLSFQITAVQLRTNTSLSHTLKTLAGGHLHVH